MRGVAPCLLLWAGCAAPAAAQHGELQFGGVVSYGLASSFREGAGAVAGIALGRLAYVGLRWVYQGGSTDGGGAGAAVTNRTRLFTMDLGLMLPVGGVEIVPGMALGAARFSQRGATPAHATEFVIGPALSIHAHVGGIVAIPEIQYLVAGHPDLPRPAATRSLVAGFRVVFPVEVQRIRY